MHPILVAIDCEKYLTSENYENAGYSPRMPATRCSLVVFSIADVSAGRTCLYPTEVRFLLGRRDARNHAISDPMRPRRSGLAQRDRGRELGFHEDSVTN